MPPPTVASPDCSLLPYPSQPAWQPRTDHRHDAASRNRPPIPSIYVMTFDAPTTEIAQLAMLASSWFGQGRAFWRWIVTAEAEPYVAAFIERQRSSDTDQPFAPIGGFGDKPDSILATTNFARLAADIEARYGTRDPTA